MGFPTTMFFDQAQRSEIGNEERDEGARKTLVSAVVLAVFR